MSKICNRKSKNLGHFDLEGLHQSRRQQKTFEVETFRVFTLPVAYFACTIDFCSYLDATMSLYSIEVCSVCTTTMLHYFCGLCNYTSQLTRVWFSSLSDGLSGTTTQLHSGSESGANPDCICQCCVLYQ